MHTVVEARYCEYLVSSSTPNEDWINEIKSYDPHAWDPNLKAWAIPRHAATIDGLKSNLERFGTVQVLNTQDISPGTDKAIQEAYPFLFPFQRQAIARALAARHYLFAFVMGTGKTMTSYAAARLTLESNGLKNILIVCPASVTDQWQVQIQKWFSMPSVIVRGSKEARKILWDSPCQTKICGYETMRIDAPSIPLKAHQTIVIADEATRLKNPNAAITKVMREWCAVAGARFALTGTPVTRDLYDYFHLLRWVDPNFMSRNFFEKHYPIKIPMQMGRKMFYKITGYKNLPDFVTRIGWHMSRETKDSIGIQLPPRTFEYRCVEQTDNEKKVEKLLKEFCRENGREIFSAWSLMHGLSDGLENFRAGDSELYQEFVTQCPVILTYPTEVSPKLAELDRVLDECEDKAVIFTQFKRFAPVVKAHLESTRSVKCLMVTGDTPTTERADIIKRFQEDATIQYLVCTDALAYGVDLWDTDLLIHLDLNPDMGIMLQRSDRIHRLSSTRPKTIVGLYSSGLESEIHQILAMKADLIEKVTDSVDMKKEDVVRTIFEKYGLKTGRSI